MKHGWYFQRLRRSVIVGEPTGNGRPESPPSHDSNGRQLTAAEAELPWKRPDNHPAVPAWRSANPDLDTDDEEEEDDGETLLRMSASPTSHDSHHDSHHDETSRNHHEKVTFF